MRPIGAHWDRELAVEVQLCPLRSGAGEEEEEKEEEKEKGGDEICLKSRKLHLAGVEVDLSDRLGFLLLMLFLQH